MSYKSQVKELYDMIFQGQIMEGFEKFYGENVTMIEASGEAFEGKDTNREREKQFVASVKEFHGGGVEGMTSDEEAGITMVENWMDVTFQDGNRVKMEQIARQKWDGDKIVEERFYYNMAG